jgi:hypothetical protein
MTEKNAPLAAVYETGVVFPRLVDLLLRYDTPKLQVEAAWCITNIACGDNIFVQYLLGYQVLSNLLHVLNHSNSNILKEQVLWALCNLSNEESVCHWLQLDESNLTLLLEQVGVQVQSYPQYVIPSSMNENPALSTMRHITIICG